MTINIKTLEQYVTETTPPTNQERVFKLMLTPTRYHDIATQLEMSFSLVKYYSDKILQERDIHSRLELITDELNDKYQPPELKWDLSKRDRDVMTYMLNGYTSADTGVMMGINETKVKMSRQRIFRATGVRSAFALVCKCYGVE